MAEGLPEGLFTNNIEAISQDIRKEDLVDVEGLTRLWRAYSTNKIVLANDVGRRLENFFWRIWSSERLRTGVSGSKVAELFAMISEGNIIRTTPTSSPRASRIMPTLRRSPRPRTAAPVDQIDDESEGSQTADASEISSELSDRAGGPSQPPTVEEEKGRRRSTSRPPPILKRPGIDTSVQSKTARILTPTWKTREIDPAHDESNFPRKTTVPARSQLGLNVTGQGSVNSPAQSRTAMEDERSSSTTTPRASSPARQRLSSSAKSSSSTTSSPLTKTAKKKPGFVVSSATTKRRPAMTRRKSSQSSSGNASKMTSPKLAQSSPPLLAGDKDTGVQFAPRVAPVREKEAGIVPKGSGRPTSRSASPVSSSPFKRPTRDHLPTATDEVNPGSSHEDWLVDRNFRSKFVDKLRAEGSPFAPLTAKSTAATGISGSFQATGSMFTSYGYGDRSPRTAHTTQPIEQRADLGSVTEETEHHEDIDLLSSKSQLTSLLNEDKRKVADKAKRFGRDS